MEINSIKTNKTVNGLTGWVDTIRHHGGLLFIEIRDYQGKIQLVTDSPDKFPEVKNEFLISISGKVVKRDKDNINVNLEHGDKEIQLSELEVLSYSKVLPFQIEDNLDIDEQIRLKYRYLDLRRPEMQRNIQLRSDVFASIRSTMMAKNVNEIDTPTLIKSTPEGARDFIVPSRKNSGKFYALPQSPQMYKQLFMISGFKSYYQIARCYRDEDSRKDRQPEFTQFDLEIPFSEPNDIQKIIEELVTNLFKDCMDINIDTPFTRISYEECILKYGTDKPDLRNPLDIKDITHIFDNTKIEFISKLISDGSKVSAVINNNIYTRGEINKLDSEIKTLGSTGLGWFVIDGDKITSPLAKIITDNEKDELNKLTKNNGTVFFQVGDPLIVNKYLAELFTIDVSIDNVYKFLWVDDFPYFETENGNLVPSHHPFTAPIDSKSFIKSPNTAKAHHYDLVLNGVELGSGSKRISDPELQIEVLKKWGLNDDEINERFSWFIEALSYGTPPHAGIALGLDRLISTMLNLTSIRDAIPFPKTQTGYDPLSEAPSRIDQDILDEYKLSVDASTVNNSAKYLFTIKGSPT